jgi:two-component system, CitB family, sensor kinase
VNVLFISLTERLNAVAYNPPMRLGRQRLWGRLRLSRQILLLQLGIIVITLGTGLAVSIIAARDQLDKQSGRQSLAIARSVAQMPGIAAALSRPPSPQGLVQRAAERVRRATGASFVVVADRRGIRYSHPVTRKVGKHVSTDFGPVLSGREYVGVQTGSLGKSVRAKVPLRSGGHIIGFVSVGLLERAVSAQLQADLPVILIPPAIGLLLGIVGSVLLARRIKRQTFDLEPDEIAALLEQREAMLHGIREGTVATDQGGRITIVNDEAKRLLDLDDSAVGQRLADVVPTGHAREVLGGNVDLPDQLVLVNDRLLVVNRMPVAVRGQAIGAVITLRDRTELEELVRERDEARDLAAALRAQEHDFSHRLHVIAGLIELERYEEAIRFINDSSLVHQALVGSIVDSVGDPALVALLLGKAAIASERGIELRVGPETKLPEDVEDAQTLISVVGNLVDNALESVATSRRRAGWIEVTIREEPDGILVRVHDSGPGVDPAVADAIFEDGFTTKVASGTQRRGLGLALVSQAVRRRGGYVKVENVEGALFTAFLPREWELTAS